MGAAGLQVLREARALVAQAWCSGAEARDAGGSKVSPWDDRAVSWSLLAAIVGLELAAIVTRDEERRRRARRDRPGAVLLGSPEEVWERAPELDLAVVASPNRFHVPLARAAAAAGLAVVVDKPLAASADDARALVREARERGVLLTVFPNRRWDGDFLTV